MKETIYTIPINEAFETAGDECPACMLYAKLDHDALEYVMGAAMMEPDVRIKTNKLGFCAPHFDRMLALGNRLSLALILESYLIEQRKTLASAKSNPACTCFVCDRRDGFMSAYYRNIYYIWETDPDFRRKFSESKLCWPHVGALLTGAQSNMGRKNLPQFRAALLDMANQRFDKLSPLVSAFCRSFDHRFADQPLGEAKTAVEQSISWLTGRKL